MYVNYISNVYLEDQGNQDFWRRKKKKPGKKHTAKAVSETFLDFSNFYLEVIFSHLHV